jgi:hypothetical protein
MDHGYATCPIRHDMHDRELRHVAVVEPVARCGTKRMRQLIAGLPTGLALPDAVPAIGILSDALGRRSCVRLDLARAAGAGEAIDAPAYPGDRFFSPSSG